jgi:lipoic acid synthetase
MLPEYLKKNIGNWAELHKMKKRLRRSELHTVCESARCPNICECFSRNVATFMILGDKCTRSCGFCSVIKGESPSIVDFEEPERIALMAESLGLKHVVVTSVTRDDLPDGGAAQFEKTINAIKNRNMRAEVLVPDFKGNPDAVRTVVKAKPDIFGHNLETVKRLYKDVRKGADYYRSLQVLAFAKELDPRLITKSGIMVGLGEKREEVQQLMKDLRLVKCDALFIGHYLQPEKKNISVREFVDLKTFEFYKKKGYELGFRWVQSGPFVRSSYLSSEVFQRSEE